MKTILPTALLASLMMAPTALANTDTATTPQEEKQGERHDKKGHDRDQEKDHGKDHDKKGHKDKDKGHAKEHKPFAIGQEVHAKITLPDITGAEHNLGQYRGKVVVIDFWSINCPWSIKHEARLKNLHATYAKKDVVFLAVNANSTEVDRDSDRPFGRIQEYVTANAIPYPILIDDHNFIADRFDAKTTPHVFILDQKGLLRYAGGMDDDPTGEKGPDAVPHAANAIDAILAGRDVSVTKTKAKGCSIKRVAPDKAKAFRKEHMQKKKLGKKKRETTGA